MQADGGEVPFSRSWSISGFGSVRCIVFVPTFYTSVLSTAVGFSVSIPLASGTLHNCMFVFFGG